MNFYIFRHGQTDWNLSTRIQGFTDIPLNSHGQRQASDLYEKLKNLDLDIIYSSDLERAFETALISTKQLNLQIVKDQRLREAYFGDAEGMLRDDAIEKFGHELWNRFMVVNPEDLDVSFPNGETRGESIQRMRSIIDEIRTMNYKNVGISTHGGVVRNLLHSYLPVGTPTLEIPNCVVYKLSFVENSATVEGPL